MIPEYHYEAVNVESQMQNPHSLLWWTRRLLALRKRYRALGEGKCEFLHPENHKILSYVLRFEDETILVVANLSRFVQPVELDLEDFNGRVPVELFGRMNFPPITTKPYFLTLSPHAFYWFSVEAPVTDGAEGAPPPARPIAVSGDWTSIFSEKGRTQFEARLVDWLPRQSWFSSRQRVIRQVALQRVFSLPGDTASARLALVEVAFIHGEHEIYSVPIVFDSSARAERIREENPAGFICGLSAENGARQGVLIDAMSDPAFCGELLNLISKRRNHKSDGGEIEGSRTAAFRQILGRDALPEATPTHQEQRNSSVGYDEKFMLKWFRRLSPGLNPDIEIGGYLTERGFPHVQRLAGTIELKTGAGGNFSLAILNEWVPNARNAWDYSLEALGRYYERIAPEMAEGLKLPSLDVPRANFADSRLPEPVIELMGTYLDSARILGERTAELHLALAGDPENPAFASENFTSHYVRGLFQSMRNTATHNLRGLRKHLAGLPPGVAGLAQQVIDREPEILECYRGLLEHRLKAKRIRCHGDFDLSQALYTGRETPDRGGAVRHWGPCQIVFLESGGEAVVMQSHAEEVHMPP
jgi:maltose alpha-D-glucosyltransferase / alpha-amylase